MIATHSPLLLATTSLRFARRDHPPFAGRWYRRARSAALQSQSGAVSSWLMGGRWLLQAWPGCGSRRRRQPLGLGATLAAALLIAASPSGCTATRRLRGSGPTRTRSAWAWLGQSLWLYHLPASWFLPSEHLPVTRWRPRRGFPAWVSPWLDHPPLFGLLVGGTALLAGEHTRPRSDPPPSGSSHPAQHHERLAPLRARRSSSRPRHRLVALAVLLPLAVDDLRSRAGRERMALAPMLLGRPGAREPSRSPADRSAARPLRARPLVKVPV